MKKGLKNLFSVLILVCFFCFSAQIALAGIGDGFSDGGSLETVAKKAQYKTGGDVDIKMAIAQIIQLFLSFLGVIFLVLMIYGGFLWMTDRGNESQVQKAKGLINAAIIGLVIVIGAYAITYFVIEGLGSDLINL